MLRIKLRSRKRNENRKNDYVNKMLQINKNGIVELVKAINIFQCFTKLW